MYLKYLSSCILLVTILFTCGFAQNIDQLRRDAQQTNGDERLDASWELFKYYRVQNKDSALYFAEINNSAAKEMGDTLSIVKSYNALGYLYKEKSEYANSIENYEKGLAIAKIQRYQDQVKFLLNNLAIVYTYYGQYDKSLEYHFESLNLREDEGDIIGMTVTYNNIGLVYYKVGDHEKALTYFLKSLNLKRQNEIDHDVERSLINIGLAYTGLEDYVNALSTYKEVMTLCEQGCPDQIAVETYSGAGLAYYKLFDFQNAEINLAKSIELAQKLNDEIYLTVGYLYLAKINYEQGNNDESLSLLDRASETVQLTDSKEWRMEIDDLYAELYERLGEYEKAYKHRQAHSQLKDSIFNEELIKNLANIQLDFQEQQTQEIIARKEFQIWRRGQINLLLGGITLLITALLIILFRNIRLKKKANKKLAEANGIIEEQNKELTNINAVLEERVKERTKALKKSNEALKRSNEELDNFIYKTSHDIRGPLATLMGVCNIAQIDVKDVQALDYFNKLSVTAFRLNEILSKLLTINQINNSALQLEDIDIDGLVNDLLLEYRSNFGNPKIDISLNVETDIHFKSDFELLRVIYGNLISNAFKFRDTSERRDSIIKILITVEDKLLVFNILDNGIGITESESEKIFEVFSKATDIADSSGIGLYLVKLAVEKLDGSIKHGITEEGLTFFKVKIPV